MHERASESGQYPIKADATSMLTMRYVAGVGFILVLAGFAMDPPAKPIAAFREIAGTWEGHYVLPSGQLGPRWEHAIREDGQLRFKRVDPPVEGMRPLQL